MSFKSIIWKYGRSAHAGDFTIWKMDCFFSSHFFHGIVSLISFANMAGFGCLAFRPNIEIYCAQPTNTKSRSSCVAINGFELVSVILVFMPYICIGELMSSNRNVSSWRTGFIVNIRRHSIVLRTKSTVSALVLCRFPDMKMIFYRFFRKKYQSCVVSSLWVRFHIYLVSKEAK